jgi:hypothetical protein
MRIKLEIVARPDAGLPEKGTKTLYRSSLRRPSFGRPSVEGLSRSCRFLPLRGVTIPLETSFFLALKEKMK